MLKLKHIEARACLECGGAPVHHRLEWVSALVDTTLTPLLDPIGRFGRKLIPFEPFFERYAPHLFRAAEKVGLGEITTEEDDLDFKFVTMCLWDEARKRNIHLEQFRPFGLPKHVFVAHKDNMHVVYERMPIPKERSRGHWWIDDKAVVKRKLQALGMPVSKGGPVFTEKEALRMFATLRKPVIAKPHHGSATRHTTLHITDEAELRRAFSVAKQLSPLVMIEEELEGHVYRPTLVNGKLVATLKRNPPQVIGDGVRSISKLIEEENDHPKRSGPVFSPIAITDRVVAEIERQGYSLDSIPEKGERVLLHQKINWGIGGTTEDVTDDVHPDNVILFEAIAKLADAPLIGIDFIAKDIAQSWKEQPSCGVIELNSMPFFDNHHLPFYGEPRNVAGHIWDMVFPEGR